MPETVADESRASLVPPDEPEAAPSRMPAAADERNGELQLVTFKLGDGEYGIDIMQVQEIIRPPEIVRVPKAPEFVEGVINMRDQVLPVIDLAKRFGATAAPGISETPAPGSSKATDSSRVVVANIKGSPAVGLIVDAVCEVIRIPSDAVGALPDIVAHADSGFLKGIARLNDRLIILVDLGKILSAEETAQLQGETQGNAQTPSGPSETHA